MHWHLEFFMYLLAMVVIFWIWRKGIIYALFGPSPTMFRVGQVLEEKDPAGPLLWVVVMAEPTAWASGYKSQGLTLTPIEKVGGKWQFPLFAPNSPMAYRQNWTQGELSDQFTVVGRMAVQIWPDWVVFNRPSQ